MAGLLGIGGSGNKTDRNTELASWGRLTNLGKWENKFGKGQQTAGAGNLATAADFFKTLLGGNQAEIGSVLAPEIGTIQNQTNQRLKTTAEFGNRSGGNNAYTNATMDEASAQIQRMISTLLGESGHEVAGIGATQAGIGLNASQIASNAFATVAGQSEDDRVKFAGPLQQAQQSEIISSLFSLGKMA